VCRREKGKRHGRGPKSFVAFSTGRHGANRQSVKMKDRAHNGRGKEEGPAGEKTVCTQKKKKKKKAIALQPGRREDGKRKELDGGGD